MLKYYRIKPGELSGSIISDWNRIRTLTGYLASPFFTPDFTIAVASVRKDVFIGIIEKEGRIAGFFPYQLKTGGEARPVGLGLSDYHGVIAEPGTGWNAEDMIRGLGIKRWDFNHLPAEQTEFGEYVVSTSDSAIVSTEGGVDALLESRDASGRKYIKEIRRKKNKLEEQNGPIFFEPASDDTALLERLMEWKSLQCRETGTVDYFSNGWCRDLVGLIHATRNTSFGGMLSCIRCGDQAAALHFGMYSDTVWHSWFPAYNHELEEFSPGAVLLMEIINAASEAGTEYLDLGKGLSLYKRRVMTGGIPVSDGCIETASAAGVLRNIRNKAEEYGRKSVLYPLLRIPGRLITGMERKRRYK